MTAAGGGAHIIPRGREQPPAPTPKGRLTPFQKFVCVRSAGPRVTRHHLDADVKKIINSLGWPSMDARLATNRNHAAAPLEAN